MNALCGGSHHHTLCHCDSSFATPDTLGIPQYDIWDSLFGISVGGVAPISAEDSQYTPTSLQPEQSRLAASFSDTEHAMRINLTQTTTAPKSDNPTYTLSDTAMPSQSAIVQHMGHSSSIAWDKPIRGRTTHLRTPTNSQQTPQLVNYLLCLASTIPPYSISNLTTH